MKYIIYIIQYKVYNIKIHNVVVVQSKPYPTFCDSVDCSTAGCPVLHYLPEFAQNHIH